MDGFGKIAFASAIIIWIITICDWGFNYTATRDIAQQRNDYQKITEIFWNVMWARLMLMALSFVALVLAIFFVPIFRENASIILVSFLLVPGHIIFPDWFFQAMEKMGFITLLNLISKLIFTVAVFVFIKDKDDFILQPLFISLGSMASGIFALYIIIIKWKIRIQKPQVKNIIHTMKGSTDVFINNFTPNLYNSFSFILLGSFGSSAATGILDAGTKFVDTSQKFMNIIGRTFFPFLARRMDRHDQYVKLNLYVSLFISFILFFLSSSIIKIFYTSEFQSAITVLRILSVTIFLMSIRNAFGTHFLLLKGYEKSLKSITFWCSIVGLALSFPLIYYFDFIGAAINILLVKMLMAVFVVFISLKIKRGKML